MSPPVGRALYMHDGSVRTLRNAVKFYNDGVVKNPWLSVRIKPLHLSEQDVDALVAFLESLAGEAIRTRRPRRSRSSHTSSLVTQPRAERR
jgi:cytochrome c peroxidase